MLKHATYTPKHAAPRPSRTAARAAAARSAMLASVAVTATGATVGAGVVISPVATVASLAAASAEDPAAVDVAPVASLATREEPISRTSDRRRGADPAKRAVLEVSRGHAVSRKSAADQDPRSIARALLSSYGFSEEQWTCLDQLWISESDWEIDADNPTSSAYGIPQALTELHDLPADYTTNAETQIRWGLDYIRDSYGSPCNAWSFKQGNNWY